MVTSTFLLHAVRPLFYSNRGLKLKLKVLVPKLIEETEIHLEWADIEGRVQHARPKRQRSSGIHLSGVLKPVLIGSGILTPLDKEQTDLSRMPLRMAIGMAIEEWAVGLWPKMRWQPGECRQDGVIGSPDGLTSNFVVPMRKHPHVDRPLEVTLLEEFKTTWCSRRTYGEDITKHRVWMWQGAGYCSMMDLRYCRFHIWWMCGDYKMGPPAPAYYTYLVEYTEQELDRFWENVVVRNLGLAVPEVHLAA